MAKRMSNADHSGQAQPLSLLECYLAIAFTRDQRSLMRILDLAKSGLNLEVRLKLEGTMTGVYKLGQTHSFL